MKIGIWPNTLSRQIVLILFGGVALALVSSAGIHLHDRRQALSAFGGMQTAQRFATIVQLLDPLTNRERRKIASVVETPLQYLRLLEGEEPIPERSSADTEETHVRSLLKRYLGNQWPIRVAVMGVSESNTSTDSSNISDGDSAQVNLHQMGGMMGGMMRGVRGGMMRGHHRDHMELMNQVLPQGISFLAQVRLSDGTWAEFHNHLPKEAFTWPKRLILSLIILFLVVTSLSMLAIRLTTRPLSLLASAAQALGQDINRPPLTISGPGEVQHATRAFNAMQARIVRYIQERTHLLAAISHDLKTPLTRMRLQLERLENEAAHEELLTNLSEMENMAIAAMDYIQGMEGMEEVQQVDIPSMLEKLQEEFQEMDRAVTLQCGDLPAFRVMRKSLKRCLINLISNAVIYGERAQIRADVLGSRLRISVADDGPGIPEDQMEKVFEPFARLEESRNRNTGGTGLGLSIARNIARAHGGELKLRNRPEGGLEVILTLPSDQKRKR